jgi:GcrA cell cycle regulator
MRGNAWTDDGVALLRELWAQGATADTIGRRLGGLSRSAVLGKVFRLRLDRGPRGESTGLIPAERTAFKDAGPNRRRGRQPRKRIAAPAAKMPGQLTLLDLKNENCRWPCDCRPGKYLFCGVAEADLARGIPYCARHMRRAYSASVSFEKTERGNFVHSVNPSTIGVAV